MQYPAPIDAVLPEVLAKLAKAKRLVLQAPPGAGKTTRTPLALLESGQVSGKILMLEPRRLATKAAAERMAHTLGEPVGQTVGYRMRGDQKVGPNTRIEVLTQGILTRMLQSDPEMPGISAILFDEFHERSLAADLGLALAYEVQQTLRDDLMLMVMSATLDAGPVAALLDHAPIVTAEGRAYPVDMRFAAKPRSAKLDFTRSVADLVMQAVQETKGGILVFLPGEAEIRRVETALQKQLPQGCVIRPLLGALPFKEQQKAVLPETNPKIRKIVLATAIAETSLTIQDIRVVVDGGKARRTRFDPARGLSTLVTDPVSRAEATQRAGRAGRVAAGACYKLWSKAEDGALPAFAPPEIEIADLAPLALDLANWGTEAGDLALLTAPPTGPLQSAQDVLTRLGALDQGKITPHGRKLSQIPAHPRLAHMLISGGPDAPYLAALLNDSTLRMQQADLGVQIRNLKSNAQFPNAQAMRKEAKRFAKFAGNSNLNQAQTLALAYPDRIAQRRPGTAPRYALSGGGGAAMGAEDALASLPYLVVADMRKMFCHKGPEPVIQSALPISESELSEMFAAEIHTENQCHWSKRHRMVVAETNTGFGNLKLRSETWKTPDAGQVIAAMIDGIRSIGLVLSPSAQRLQARVALAQSKLPDLPNTDDQSLLDTLETWLAPFLDGIRTEADWRKFDPTQALDTLIGWNNLQALDKIAPAFFRTPLGRKIVISYTDQTPEVSLRLQEVLGQTTHPMVGTTPIKMTLLSPAQRPIQVTQDLPGFWRGSYADVRKDMRARYPRHEWPEDPTQATPTLRAKPRKT